MNVIRRDRLKWQDFSPCTTLRWVVGSISFLSSAEWPCFHQRVKLVIFFHSVPRSFTINLPICLHVMVLRKRVKFTLCHQSLPSGMSTVNCGICLPWALCLRIAFSLLVVGLLLPLWCLSSSLGLEVWGFTPLGLPEAPPLIFLTKGTILLVDPGSL